MQEQHVRLRDGTIEDAPLLAKLVNYAGEGLPLYLWSSLAGQDESAWDVGRSRAEREEGDFSYRNATIAEIEGKPVATLIGYEISDQPEEIDPDLPALFVPLLQLEALAPGTWYVNVLAVLPEFRNRGLGRLLLEKAEEISRQLGKSGMSVIVADNNRGAWRLYEDVGYRESDRRQMVKDNWESDGENWILLTKSL